MVGRGSPSRCATCVAVSSPPSLRQSSTAAAFASTPTEPCCFADEPRLLPRTFPFSTCLLCLSLLEHLVHLMIHCVCAWRNASEVVSQTQGKGRLIGIRGRF